jgi:tellurium resistance protein TerZ
MPAFISTNGLEGVELSFIVIKGEGLAAKDRNLMGQRTTSDPYVIVSLQTTLPAVGRSKPKTTVVELGKTKTVEKTLSPVWNQAFTTKVPVLALSDPKAPPTLIFTIYDYDANTDDDLMGIVKVPIPMDPPKSSVTTEWYKVPESSASNAKGKIQVKLQTTIQRSTALQRGNAFVLETNHLMVGLAWDVVKGKAVDLDAACVAVDDKGQISMTDSVYYGNLANPNGSIVHSGDSLDGKAGGDDETITFLLDKIPASLVALYIVLTVASARRFLSSIESARCTLVDKSKKNQSPMASFTPSKHVDSEAATALFLVRLARDGKKWKVQPIEDVHKSAREFGSMIPHFKSYTRDLVPGIKVDPHEKVMVMRKGGTIKIRDFCVDKVLPNKLTFGLSWDVNTKKGGKKVDLDASAICFDNDLKLVDKVWFKHLTSDDGSIVHSGDQRKGDATGDDEQLAVDLSKVAKNVQYIGFVVNSYSGQELDDVEKAACHLFDTVTKVDIAVHSLGNCEFLDGHTALVMGCVYRIKTRTKKESDWCLKIVSVAADGKTVKDLVAYLREYLEANPVSAPLESLDDEDEKIDATMPKEVPVKV